MIRRFESDFERYGYGLHAVDLIDTRVFIHRLHRLLEASSACLEYGFRVLGFDMVYSFTAKINAPSVALMQRLGMRYEMRFGRPDIDPADRLYEHVLYSIARPSSRTPPHAGRLPGGALGG